MKRLAKKTTIGDLRRALRAVDLTKLLRDDKIITRDLAKIHLLDTTWCMGDAAAVEARGVRAHGAELGYAQLDDIAVRFVLIGGQHRQVVMIALYLDTKEKVRAYIPAYGNYYDLEDNVTWPLMRGDAVFNMTALRADIAEHVVVRGQTPGRHMMLFDNEQLHTLLVLGTNNGFFKTTFKDIVQHRGPAALTAVTALLMLPDQTNAATAWAQAKAKCPELPAPLPADQLRMLVNSVVDEFVRAEPLVLDRVHDHVQLLGEHDLVPKCVTTALIDVNRQFFRTAGKTKLNAKPTPRASSPGGKGRYIVRFTPARPGIHGVDEVRCAKYEEAWDYALMEEEEYTGRIDLIEVKDDGTEVVHQTW